MHLHLLTPCPVGVHGYTDVSRRRQALTGNKADRYCGNRQRTQRDAGCVGCDCANGKPVPVLPVAGAESMSRIPPISKYPQITCDNLSYAARPASACVAKSRMAALRTTAEAVKPSACACRAILALSSGGQRNEITGASVHACSSFMGFEPLACIQYMAMCIQ